MFSIDPEPPAAIRARTTPDLPYTIPTSLITRRRMRVRRYAGTFPRRALLGYLRDPDVGPPSLTVEPLRRQMRAYAESAGATLAEVFIDIDDDRIRPSSTMTELIHPARRTPSMAVIIPSMEHLARGSGVQRTVKKLPEYHTGIPVLTLRPRSPWPPCPAFSATPRA